MLQEFRNSPPFRVALIFLIASLGGAIIAIVGNSGTTSTWVFSSSTPEAADIAEPAAATTTREPLSMIFAGDIMLDRNVYRATQRAGTYAHPFLLIDDFLKQYPLRIVNLEGPITDTAFDLKRAQAMSFTFDPKFTPELAKRFDVVSLANNHTHNFLEKGLITTKQYLDKEGVEYFGDPINRRGKNAIVVEKGGYAICLVGYHAFGGPESKTIPVIEQEIKDCKPKADFVAVMPHWGPEYKPTAHPSQVYAGHRFIDAGADAVIGGHPHVVQNLEMYKGKPIYYSLGNFIFDQYFSKETMEGQMVAVELKEKGEQVEIGYKVIPYKINKESQPFIP